MLLPLMAGILVDGLLYPSVVLRGVFVSVFCVLGDVRSDAKSLLDALIDVRFIEPVAPISQFVVW